MPLKILTIWRLPETAKKTYMANIYFLVSPASTINDFQILASNVAGVLQQIETRLRQAQPCSIHCMAGCAVQEIRWALVVVVASSSNVALWGTSEPCGPVLLRRECIVSHISRSMVVANPIANTSWQVIIAQCQCNCHEIKIQEPDQKYNFVLLAVRTY